jgi:hypothetical protein
VEDDFDCLLLKSCGGLWKVGSGEEGKFGVEEVVVVVCFVVYLLSKVAAIDRRRWQGGGVGRDRREGGSVFGVFGAHSGPGEEGEHQPEQEEEAGRCRYFIAPGAFLLRRWYIVVDDFAA